MWHHACKGWIASFPGPHRAGAVPNAPLDHMHKVCTQGLTQANSNNKKTVALLGPVLLNAFALLGALSQLYQIVLLLISSRYTLKIIDGVGRAAAALMCQDVLGSSLSASLSLGQPTLSQECMCSMRMVIHATSFTLSTELMRCDARAQ